MTSLLAVLTGTKYRGTAPSKLPNRDRSLVVWLRSSRTYQAAAVKARAVPVLANSARRSSRANFHSKGTAIFS